MARQPLLRGNFPNDHANAEGWFSASGKINEMTDDIYALQSRTVSVSDIRFASGATVEARINLAIVQAKAELASRVLVTGDHLPYNVNLVTFDDDVQMVREGGIQAGGIWDAAAYGGKHSALSYPEHGYSIRAAAAACAANGGGSVDCQGFPSDAVIILDTDIAGLLNAYDKTPITFVWGSHEIRVKHFQTLRSHHHHTLRGATFVSKDENGGRVLGVTMFKAVYTDVMPTSGITTTSGSGTITKTNPGVSSWGMLENDSPLLIHGRIPPIGHDSSTLNGGIDASVSTITVVSATWGLPVGTIRIENEIVTYTGKNTTQFTGCVRGAMGTTAAAHSNGVTVERVCVEPFFVESMSGDSMTLGQAETMDITSTALTTSIGVLDVTFDGVGIFDGNKDVSTDDFNNPFGIHIQGGRHIRISPNLVFKNFDHGGVMLELCQDFKIEALFAHCGRPASSLGSSVWIFGRNKRGRVVAEVQDALNGVTVDDRTIAPQDQDGACEGIAVHVVSSRVQFPIAGEGCRRCELSSHIADNLLPNGYAIKLSAEQWVTVGTPTRNVLRIGPYNGDASVNGFNLDSDCINGNNVVVVEHVAPTGVMADGNSLVTPAFLIGLTYAASITPAPERSTSFSISITNNSVFTIDNPATTSRSRARPMSLLIGNDSGGAHGTITMGNQYLLQGGGSTLPAIANTKHRWFHFLWTGSFWEEVGRSASDVG